MPNRYRYIPDEDNLVSVRWQDEDHLEFGHDGSINVVDGDHPPDPLIERHRTFDAGDDDG
jgi:hypothetical protein